MNSEEIEQPTIKIITWSDPQQESGGGCQVSEQSEKNKSYASFENVIIC